MVLPRRTSSILLLLLIALTVLEVAPLPPAQAAGSSVPTSLSVKVAPSTLPADGGTYPAVYVSLVDSSGAPTLAVSNVVVFLTSSTPTVGVVLNSSLVIAVGKGYAMAAFKSTPTVGSTEITATATGYASGSATVTTVVPHGYPTSISLMAVPAEVNSTSTSSRTGTLIIEFQDQAGLPVKAIEDTPVSLYSSSPRIVTLNETVIHIKAGQLVGILSFATGFVPGSAIVTASSPQLNSGTAQVTVLGRPPLALELYAQPDKLVTSGSGRLVIALTDLNGEPTRAFADTLIQIRSSNTSAVSVPETATIPAGSIYTAVTMSTGPTPDPAGVTITASSSGLKSGFATVSTYKPNGPPTALKLYVGPSTVLADHGNYSAVAVSLVSKDGFPTVNNSTTPYDVILTSSHNSSVGDFGPSAFTTMSITKGLNNVVWSTNFTSTFVAGTTFLTVSAKDLLPDTGTISTYGPVPSKIAIAAVFPATPADGESHPALQVSLEDSSGAPAVAASPVAVYLNSSQTGIAQVDSPVIIKTGESAAVADVRTTSVSGVANITAYTNSLSTGYTSASVLVQTITPSPSKIGAYLVQPVLAPSPSQPGTVLLLQLQDSSGNPVKARAATNLTVTSSDSGVFNRTLRLQVVRGATFVDVPIAPLRSGSTTFTVTSSGLVTAAVQLQVLDSPFASRILASSLSILANQTATVTYSMTIDGQGVPGANVTWSATNGVVEPATSVTNAQGQAVATFRPTSVGVGDVVANVTSSISGKQGYSVAIIVNQVPEPKSSGGLLGMLVSWPFLLAWPAVAAVVAVVLFLFLRRRKRAAEAEESVGEEEEQGFSYYRTDPIWGRA